MNYIREVKDRADIVKVAEIYGLELNRANKCICPFHKEKTASFSVSARKQIWHCFGCDKGGDVISLVSELLNLNALEAAKNINYKLNLGLDLEKPNNFEINKFQSKKNLEEAFKKWENKTFQLLCDYLHLLEKWEEKYRPKNPEEEVNELFIEALKNKNYIEYLLDEIFINGSNQEKIWFWKTQKKVVRNIESRIRTFRTVNE